MTFTCQNATCRGSRRGSGTVRHKTAKNTLSIAATANPRPRHICGGSAAQRQFSQGIKKKKKKMKPQKLFRSSGYLSNQIAGSAFGLVSIHSAVTEVKELSSELSGFPRIVCTADLYIYSFILIVFSCLRKNLR